MTVLERISEQLQAAFEGLKGLKGRGMAPQFAWHGPSVLQLLEDVTAAQAASRPNAGSHTIWELVRHIGVWEDEVRKCLEGEKFRWISEEEDWPQVHDTSEEAWRKTVKDLEKVHHLLLETLSRFDVNRLDSIVPSEPGVPVPWSSTSFYSLLNGIIQHAAYHAGQIAILKKG